MLENIPTIDNRYFVALITILGFVLTMVTAKGGLTNNSFRRRWWKRYTKRGKQAIGLGLLTFCILLLQENNNQNVSNFKDKSLKFEQDSKNKKISEGINKGVEKSTEKLFEKLSLAFRKQGLQYDSIKNQVIKLRDSVRVTQVTNDTPLIGLNNLEIIDSTFFDQKTYKVKYYLTSHDAKSLNIDLKFDVFAFTSSGDVRTLFKNFRILYKGQSINKNETLFNNLTVSRDNSYYLIYAFRLKGSYFSSINEKFYIDKFYLLTPRKKTDYFTFPVQIHEDLLRAHLVRFYID